MCRSVKKVGSGCNSAMFMMSTTCDGQLFVVRSIRRDVMMMLCMLFLCVLNSSAKRNGSPLSTIA